jgi:excinuclease ABC subunit B
VLITTLTKKNAEDLTNYLKEQNYKAEYLHSDVDTIDRIKLIRSLRLGEIDIMIGINLLREGLDIPECGLVAILDADKEGFLRSKTSLVQTIGRAARNIDGKVILYADIKTKSIKAALEETDYRKKRQINYNKLNNITPKSVKRNMGEIIESIYEKDSYTVSLSNKDDLSPSKFEKHLQKLEKKMLTAAENLDFEKAAVYRDEIRKIKKDQMGVN